jgi:hypothetical protein
VIARKAVYVGAPFPTPAPWTFKVSVNVVLPLGVNVTITEQGLPLLTLPPTRHGLPVTWNCVPVVMVIVPMINGAMPELVSLEVAGVASVTAPYAHVPLPRLIFGAKSHKWSEYQS